MCKMNSSKQKRSNEQRLKAVEEKRDRLKSRQLSIKVTNGVSASNQHLVFTTDSEDSSTQENEQKLELFGDDGSDESDSEAAQEFVNWGEKFEGDRGAQLFQLQQKIGHDARFRVDERFLDDKEMVPVEGMGEGGRREAEDDIGEQIWKEKANALRIINSMFGDSYTEQLNCGQKLTSANCTHVLPLRYDPNSDTCAELELEHAPHKTPPLQEIHCVCSPANREHLDPPPDISSPAQLQQAVVVSNERYYNVSEDIKELFSSSNEKFSFLADMDGDSDDNFSMNESSSTMLTTKSTSSSAAPKWIKNINRVSPSSSEDDEAESAKVIPMNCKAGSLGSVETRLFFHSSIPRLRNRLDENSFYRSEALSELESSWPQRRTAMKQSFRKRRKDAMKMAKKKRKLSSKNY